MRAKFFSHQAQTSEHPLAIEVDWAKGSYLFDKKGKKYLDFIAGVSANTLGHNHPAINDAIIAQLTKYSHVMVYGEFIQEAPVELATLLAAQTPSNLNSVYLTNSGTEATEAAIKLAKRVTGRSEIIAAKNAYHGNTQGAMSVCGNEQKKGAYRPLIPGTTFIQYNDLQDLAKITEHTAAVILETIQGGAGFIAPEDLYLKKVKARCEATGTLLILDEIQTGIGRTGTFFGFENYQVVPDMIITGKGLGGGMPIGALIAKQADMAAFQTDPPLGHITTFGGHPVIAAAGLATLKTLLNGDLMAKTLVKEQLIRTQLQHPSILEIRGKGLLLALIFKDANTASQVILKCLEKGLLLFWLLFEGRAVRITPPLTINESEIKEGCRIILEVLDELA
ncbi:aspartate aminotransferase family protein [Flavobacteriaceae bacterium F08102]|nr:aspartate aminotransferase family protein [Flavobacteriaceae bacterium F08102]